MTCPKCGGQNFSASVGNRYKLYQNDVGEWSASFSDCYEVIVSCDSCWEHIPVEDTDIDLDNIVGGNA